VGVAGADINDVDIVALYKPWRSPASQDADRDQDGWVSLNELYDYVIDKVREQNPHQTPSRDVEMQGELYLARRSRPVSTPSPLPPELHEVIEHPLVSIRAGAVQELARLLHGRHAGLALAAKLALERLADDDSRMVAAAAEAALATRRQRRGPGHGPRRCRAVPRRVVERLRAGRYAGPGRSVGCR
jgi:hypothetical protein